jgi:hypothetical protein
MHVLHVELVQTTSRYVTASSTIDAAISAHITNLQELKEAKEALKLLKTSAEAVGYQQFRFDSYGSLLRSCGVCPSSARLKDCDQFVPLLAFNAAQQPLLLVAA